MRDIFPLGSSGAQSPLGILPPKARGMDNDEFGRGQPALRARVREKFSPPHVLIVSPPHPRWPMIRWGDGRFVTGPCPH